MQICRCVEVLSVRLSLIKHLCVGFKAVTPLSDTVYESDFYIELALCDHTPRLFKKIMLNSAKHEIFPAYKCKNANNCWHFHIYEQEKYHSRLI